MRPFIAVLAVVVIAGCLTKAPSPPPNPNVDNPSAADPPDADGWDGGYDPRFAVLGARDAGGIITDSGLPWSWSAVAEVLATPPASGGVSQRWVPVLPLATDRAWAGGVLLFDGGVVAIPFDEPAVLVIHPNDDTSERWPVEGGGVEEGWEGGVLLPDGTVLAFPRNASRFLRIDPKARTATPFGDDLSDASDGGVDKFRGGVLALNGQVYAAPSQATFVARLDPVTGHVTRLKIPPKSHPGLTQGAVVFPTGDIVLFPAQDGAGLLVVPSRTGEADQVWLLPQPPSPDLPAFVGGGLLTGVASAYAAPEQNVYPMRYEEGLFKRSEAVPGLDRRDANSYLFGAWSTDGHLYLPPFGALGTLVLDVASNQPKVVPELTDGGTPLFRATFGAVGLPDGRIIGIPHGRSSWLELTPSGRRTVSPEAMTSPFLNKL